MSERLIVWVVLGRMDGSALVEGVFSTLDLAEKYALGSGYRCEIQEWALDNTFCLTERIVRGDRMN